MFNKFSDELEGRTILDCSEGWPGPFMGRLLMEKGARVLKIENPKKDDRSHMEGAHYDWLNHNKEIVKLDLTTQKDRRVFESLVQRADGLIEAFRPQARTKIGLDEATLHSINPRLCIASIVGYPEDGPFANRPGHEINYEALTGLISIFDGMPSLAISDLFTSYEAALAMVSTLDFLARNKDAAGKRIVVSIFETSQKVQFPLIIDYQETRVLPKYGETLFTGRLPSNRLYESKDGRKIAVGPVESRYWNRLCELIGTPELKDQSLASGDKAKEVIRKMQAAFSQKTWEEWEAILDGNDCCVEVVKDYSELY